MTIKWKYEQGVVMMVTLLILLVLTLLGTAGMKSTVLEEKMAGNYRDNNLAFQSAEAGLREAESFLDLTKNPVDGDYSDTGANSPGLYNVVANTPPRWESVTWVGSQSFTETIEYGTGHGNMPGAALHGVSEQSKYIIEEIANCPGGNGALGFGKQVYPCFYRVTSRGIGGTTSSTVMVQSTYKRY